ncbi:energy transducer TonB [bacterium]|nr:energy transducer TonB [candidate division CSSED10-310 bacterium]
MTYDQISKQKDILRKRDRISMDWAILIAIILHIMILYIPPVTSFSSHRNWDKERTNFIQMQRYKPPPPPKEEKIEEPKVKKKKQVLAKPIPQQEMTNLEDIAIDDEDVELVYDINDVDFDEPEPPPEGPLRVGGDVSSPKRIHYVAPEYPDIARRTRIQGIVILEAIINKQGDVVDVKVLKSLNSLCDQAAINAARQWKFEPGTQNDIPVDVVMTLTVQFQLR